MLYNAEKIRLTYKTKHNFKHKNQVILLVITDGKKLHFLAVKILSAFLRGITSNHNGDFYCLNCFHSYSTENKLKKHEKVCNDHDYCYVKMLDEFNKILKYNQPWKKVTKSSSYYLCWLREFAWKNIFMLSDFEKSYTEKKNNKHTPSGYSIFKSKAIVITQENLEGLSIMFVI